MKEKVITAPAKHLPGIVPGAEWQQAECNLVDVLIYYCSLPQLSDCLAQRPIPAHYHHHQLVLLSHYRVNIVAISLTMRSLSLNQLGVNFLVSLIRDIEYQ
jgi:hypothetical protein